MLHGVCTGRWEVASVQLGKSTLVEILLDRKLQASGFKRVIAGQLVCSSCRRVWFGLGL